MGWIGDVASRVVAMLPNLVVSLLKSFNRKALVITGVILAAVMLIGGAYFLGATHGSRSSTPPPASPREHVGGLDLAKYCESYSYSEVDTEFCTASIDLDSACNWQYKRTDLRVSLKPNQPYSGKCIDRQQKNVGGIKDMAGYCTETYQGSIDVQPVVTDDKTWACRARINKNLACGWQYQTENLVAVKESAGIWACYKP